MKTLSKTIFLATVLVLMLVADIPLIPDIPPLQFELVPEAQAIYGTRRRTRRRTAVVAYSAGKSTAAASQQQAAAAQQQAAAAEAEAAAAKQQAAEAEAEAAAAKTQKTEASSGAPLGQVVEALPEGCVPVTVGDSQYQKCGETFYRAAFMGNKLVFVTVAKPF